MTANRTTKYRINSIMEEGACDYCGTPFFVDEHAYEKNGHIYCSPNCAELDSRDHPEWSADAGRPISNKLWDSILDAREAAAQARAESVLPPLPEIIEVTRAEMPELFAKLDAGPAPTQISFGNLADSTVAVRTLPGGQRSF